MRKGVVFLSALLLALFLVACGQDDVEPTEPTVEDSTEGESNNTEDDQSTDDEEMTEDEGSSNDTDVSGEAKDHSDMKGMMEELNFTEIELEIDYGKDQEYAAEIERHSDGDIEAELEDEINGRDIDDDLEAFNVIYPLVKKLDIDQQTDKQDVIDQVLEAFDLEASYEEFEVEIKFEDGTKLSFED